jgi:hypothetical protein
VALEVDGAAVVLPAASPAAASAAGDIWRKRRMHPRNCSTRGLPARNWISRLPSPSLGGSPPYGLPLQPASPPSKPVPSNRPQEASGQSLSAKPRHAEALGMCAFACFEQPTASILPRPLPTCFRTPRPQGAPTRNKARPAMLAIVRIAPQTQPRPSACRMTTLQQPLSTASYGHATTRSAVGSGRAEGRCAHLNYPQPQRPRPLACAPSASTSHPGEKFTPRRFAVSPEAQAAHQHMYVQVCSDRIQCTHRRACRSRKDPFVAS